MKKYIKHALLCLSIMVMAMAVLTGCGGKKQINLRDYVEVTLASANGYGEAHAVTDDAGLEALVLSDGAEKKSDLEILAMWDLLAKVDYTLDKTDHLSNGDIITVTVCNPGSTREHFYRTFYRIRLRIANNYWHSVVFRFPNQPSLGLFLINSITYRVY